MTEDNNISQDHWRYLFSAETIAVIGASNKPGTWGYNITKGLLDSDERKIYPVNPKAGEILGLKAYGSLSDIPGPVELAVIVVAENLVPGVLRECVSKEVKTGIIITSGFGEMGENGRKLEAELVGIANSGGIRFIGPNSMGHADGRTKLSTFGQRRDMPLGPVAVLSQSGSMCLSIVFNLAERGVFCSKYVSTGNEASLHFEDYLEFLAEDDDTKIIAAYIEGLRDGRRFMRLAREIAPRKPIIIIKAGGTEESAKAVMSHTGALAGKDAVYTAAFRQTGVIRVEDNDELCDVVYALHTGPLPRGKKVGILSIGGGPGALSAEACEKEGLLIGKLEESTIKELDKHLSSRWPRRNPVDMAGATSAEFGMVGNLVSALIEDNNTDILILLVPLMMPNMILSHNLGLGPEEIKAYREDEGEKVMALSEKAQKLGKPLILISQFRDMVNDPEIMRILNKGKILVYNNSGQAARIMRKLVRYREYLEKRDIRMEVP